MAYNREVEIKAPMRSWRKQSRPINSVVAYRDWLYSASRLVEGSPFQVTMINTNFKVYVVTFY